MAGRLLGTTHPPGNPGYLLLNHAFTGLFPLGSVATRANLLSAVCAVGAALLSFAALRRLAVPPGYAAAAVAAVGVTPTWWRYAVVAEVYALHLLFLSAVFWALVRWPRTRRDRDLYLACGLYAFGFGNHLSLITVLPAFAYVVWSTDRAVFVDRRRVAVVAGLITLAALQYLYPLWRSRVPSTPYLAVSTPDLDTLIPYVTGRDFHAAMFAAPLDEILRKKLPGWLRLWAAECGPLLPFAVLGALRWRDRASGGFLLLTALGTVAFALGYEIVDIEAYYLPLYWVTTLWAAAGMADIAERWSASGPRGLRPAWLLAAALPLGLAPLHWDRVQREKRPDAARRVEEFLQAAEAGQAPRALVVAGYHEYQYLLYYLLIEDRGGGRVFPERMASVDELRAYLASPTPLYQRHLRRWIPPGLPVYCTKGLREDLFRAAGLRTDRVGWNLYRITLAEAGDGRAP